MRFTVCVLYSSGAISNAIIGENYTEIFQMSMIFCLKHKMHLLMQSSIQTDLIAHCHKYFFTWYSFM